MLTLHLCSYRVPKPLLIVMLLTAHPRPQRCAMNLEWAPPIFAVFSASSFEIILTALSVVAQKPLG